MGTPQVCDEVLSLLCFATSFRYFDCYVYTGRGDGLARLRWTINMPHDIISFRSKDVVHLHKHFCQTTFQVCWLNYLYGSVDDSGGRHPVCVSSYLPLWRFIARVEDHLVWMKQPLRPHCECSVSSIIYTRPSKDRHLCLHTWSTYWTRFSAFRFLKRLKNPEG